MFYNKRTETIHHFVRAQLVGGAKLALAWVRNHHRKIDFHFIARVFSDNKKYYLTRHYDAVSEPAERMIDRLLERDTNFFSEYHYDAMAQVPNELLDKTKIDDWI